MSNYKNLNEYQLRVEVFNDYFKYKDTVAWQQEFHKIDFAIFDHKSKEKNNIEKYYVWMEAKATESDIYIMLTQLLLTIHKALKKVDILPPPYIGCFNFEKITFVPMKLLIDILHASDIKWNITSSDKKNEYFLKIISKLQYALYNSKEVKTFTFGTDDEGIKNFVRRNIYKGESSARIQITEYNFDRIYLKWVEKVKPSIAIDWKKEKDNNGLIDADFYLADLLSREGLSIKEKLLIILLEDHYKITKAIKKSKIIIDETEIHFKDKQKAYIQFWNIYDRPPLPIYWENIISRKDLLVPQDIRERKGSFFTPQIWVELSQKYIADTLGENWQDEYYVWDCAAGTGNLLVGINRKIENVFASTIDESDVKAMHVRIDNGARLLKKNVFQFDFLNDDFNKLPKTLKDIIDDHKKRKKLIIYINPPFAEVSSVGKKGKKDVCNTNILHKYTQHLGTAGRELFTQFLMRIYFEIDGCIISNFSTLKVLMGSGFVDFRKVFKAKLLSCFIMPSYTFDNVPGKFPIGFKIWNTNDKKTFKTIISNIYQKQGEQEYIKIGKKTIKALSKEQYINKWISSYKINGKYNIGFLAGTNGNDFQQNQIVYILNNRNQMSNPRGIEINENNLIECSIFFAARKTIDTTWLNNTDQFQYPNDEYKKDFEFQNDCLMVTMFHEKNMVKRNFGINYWIPFREIEVNQNDKFESHFLTDFIAGKIKQETDYLFDNDNIKTRGKIEFSTEASDVFNAGKKLWKFYHNFTGININASLWDIKAYFQGTDKKGDLINKNKCDNKDYRELIDNLSDKLELLAKKIEPKIYEYGFLKRT